MKKLVFIFLSIILTFPTFSQNLFESLVDQYSDQEGFSAVQLSKDMFDLYLKKKNIPENDPLYSVVNNLKNILVITQTKESEEEDLLKNIQSEILDYYKNEGMILLKTEKKSGNDLKIYIEKDDNGISSLGLVNLSDLSLTLIELNGSIDMGSIASLNRAFNIKGLDALQQIDNSTSHFMFPELTTPGDIKRIRYYSEDKDIKTTENHRILDKGMAEVLQQKRSQIFLRGNAQNVDIYINGQRVNKDSITNLDPNVIEKIEVEKRKENGEKSGVIKITTK